ncbi:MAG: serine/threonine protein kinase [Planctomycetota bacterium]|nr:MAG: serine/threonine protein kinase [Planctomycetota bacterium]
MPPTADQLVDRLSRLRLAEPEMLRGLRTQLPATADADQLLEILIKQQVLTDFQAERIRSGDTDGLVLADCKLMYRVASGSFARFYRGAELSNGRTIGIKVLRDRWSNDRDVVNLFHREGEIGKRLQHPHIVPIYEVGHEGNYHFLLMEFVEGGNLRDFLKIRKKLAPVEAMRYAVDIAKGLEYGIRQGITHRDLKLTNVLMSSTGIAKLIDFGLAAEDSVLSRVGGEVHQALEYSTLEKNTGAPRNDPRSDLYFLGGILFELMTGVAPYARTRDRDERKSFSRYRDVPNIEIVAPSIPAPVAAFVNRMLSVVPSERHQTATEVLGEAQRLLNQLGAGQPAKAGDQPRVMCIETRVKHQEFLRDYLASRGFNVEIVEDPEAALELISSEPPDAILVLGETIGQHVAEYFSQAIKLGRESRMAGVIVLAENQTALAERINVPPGRARILRQPVNLRDVRKELELALEARARAR